MTQRRARATLITAALTLGITFGTAALPAQADYLGSGDNLFRITTHVQDIGPVSTWGTTGKGKNLEAVYVTQLGTRKMCVKAHVAEIGWQTTRCTTGKGTSVSAGTTGQNRAIESLIFNTPGKWIGGNAHLRGTGWDHPAIYGESILLGTVGRGIPMEAFWLTY